MKKINFRQLLPFFIIAAGIVVFVILKLTKPSAQPVIVKERIWQVKTLSVTLQTLKPSITLYGQIETPALVKAAAPDKSRVISIAVNEGDPIQQGQLLLSLDPRDFQPLVAQATAKVAELEAMIISEQLHYQSNRQAYTHEKSLLKLSQSAVKRAEMLKNKKLGSVAALEEAEQSLRRQQLSSTEKKLLLDDHSAIQQQLEARLQYAQAELQMAQLNLERSQIIAPFDGFIESLQVATGDQANENQLLLSFYPLDQMEVRAKIPTAFQHELLQALSNKQRLSATANFAGTRLKLEFDRVAGMADTRGIDGLFRITEGTQLVRLGSTLTLSLQRPALPNSVAIPFSALYDNDRVYKLVDGQLQAIQVRRLGEYVGTDDKVSLLISSTDLHNGDQLVVTHLPNAINGLRVESI